MPNDDRPDTSHVADAGWIHPAATTNQSPLNLSVGFTAPTTWARASAPRMERKTHKTSFNEDMRGILPYRETGNLVASMGKMTKQPMNMADSLN